MDIVYPPLQELYREPMPYPGQKDGSGLLAGASAVGPWIPVLNIAGAEWRFRRPDPQRLYFPSPDEDELIVDLQSRIDFANTIGLYSKITGRPALLIGELESAALPVTPERAASYLEREQFLFGGVRTEQYATLVRFTRWDDQTTQVAFQQTNKQRVPVYGARFVATYDAKGRLVMVTNSFYPISPLPLFPAIELNADQLEKILANVIPQKIGFARLLDPNEVRWPLWERWILPVPLTQATGTIAEQLDYGLQFWERTVDGWHRHMPKSKAAPDPARSSIHAALRVPIVDQYGDPWAAWLDANDFGLLKLDYLAAHAKVNYDLYQSAQAAIDNTPQSTELDLGITGTTLRTSPNIKLCGDRLYDPNDPTDVPTPPIGPTDIRRLLGATVYHHLWRAQQTYASFLTTVLDFEKITPNPRFCNPLKKVTAKLDSTGGDSRFLPQSGQILFRTGVTTAPMIAEPAQDGEVIFHEFTHALLHYLYPHLMEHSLVDEWIVLSRGLDEGLAFYLACIEGDNARWGDFAYEDWQPARDLDIAPQPFALDAFDDDPGEEYYGYAIWWSRLFWSLHLNTDVAPNLERVLFKTLHSLASVVPSTDITGGDELEDDLRNAYNLMAQIFYLFTDPGPAQPVVAQAFTNVALAVT